MELPDGPWAIFEQAHQNFSRAFSCSSRVQCIYAFRGTDAGILTENNERLNKVEQVCFGYIAEVPAPSTTDLWSQIYSLYRINSNGSIYLGNTSQAVADPWGQLIEAAYVVVENAELFMLLECTTLKITHSVVAAVGQFRRTRAPSVADNFVQHDASS